MSQIRCLNGANGFTPGKSYRIVTSTFVDIQSTIKEKMDGEADDVELSAQEMAIGIYNDNKKLVYFSHDRRGGADYDFRTLAHHFEIPEVPDVARMHRDGYAQNLDRLDVIERWIQRRDPSFQFIGYQRDDIARAALRDGVVLMIQS